MAATLDDEPDMDINRLSVAPSNYELEVDKGGISPFSDEFRLDDKAPGTPGEAPLLEDDDEQLVRSSTTDPESSAQRSKRKESKRRNRNQAVRRTRETLAATTMGKTPNLRNRLLCAV